MHNLIPDLSRHVEYVTSRSYGWCPPPAELSLSCLLASLFTRGFCPCVTSSFGLHSWPFCTPLPPALLCVPARWPAQGVQLCSLLPSWRLPAGSAQPVVAAAGTSPATLHLRGARGSSGQKGFLQNVSPKSYACMYVCMYLFIYLRCSNWVPLGTHNVTKSGQCFHGAEGMLVKLGSSSACMETLDLEWIEVGKSIWAWK